VIYCSARYGITGVNVIEHGFNVPEKGQAGAKTAKLQTKRVAVNVVASLLIMACAGSVYAWSIFVAPLREDYGFSAGDTQVIFGVIIACFSVTMLFVARIERKLGPRLTTAIGAVLFCGGYLTASFSGGRVWQLLLGIGVLSGAGMGFGYMTVLTTLVKWLPHRPGLATGIAVAGFGSGAILLAAIAQPLLDSGLSVMEIFRNVGIIYGLLFLIGAAFISTPKGTAAGRVVKPLSYTVILRDKRFWVLAYTFFAGSFSGLMLIGNLKPLGISYNVGAGAAVLAVTLVSAGNAIGRVLWGHIYDKIGGKRSVGIALGLLTALVLLLLAPVGQDIVFLLLSLFIGLNFGANFVLYASEVARHYGPEQLGVVYPALSPAYGVSGILGPIAGGYAYDATGGYAVPVILAAVICLSGLLVFVITGRRPPQSY
jgi:OFA family oxalate/formate antiporter-like MFS transporter